MECRVSYTVYYEDTDCLGIVYYANYFKYMERGRTEYLAANGTSIADWNREGIAIVVASAKARFRKPARLGDVLDVVTTFTANSRFRGTFTHRIECAGTLLVNGTVEVACVDGDQRLRELPDLLVALSASPSPAR
ncbi:MAG: acyl-CoA thioester hydrolase [Actinomycetota bacterium]|nr:acyl-CoA thioester hydrolase [Actinomycetota bacterium]